jgi:predicted dehydrogenase
MKTRKFRIAAISFDHFHVGDNLRMAMDHPQAEIVGVFDENKARVQEIVGGLGLAKSLIKDDYRQLIESTKPDLILLCPATARHGEWVEKVAFSRACLLIEKPFASSLAEASRMIQASRENECTLAINWPLTWVPAHQTAFRLGVTEKAIGEIQSVNYYGGNRGPLWHTFDKLERTSEQVNLEKPHSWFYQRQSGGGSLLDYLGYGATLGTWFLEGRIPTDVTCVVDFHPGLEVDEHSITVCRYPFGLSRMETRWGTFTDPWNHQTQPACGFTLIGTEGTIRSSDYSQSIRLQNSKYPGGVDIPVDTLAKPNRNPIEYVLDRLERGLPIDGPLSPDISWGGQRIVDTAFESAQQRKTLDLLNYP